MKSAYLDPFSIHMDFAPCAACIGYFDGIHRGHQELIRRAVSIAREKGLRACLITFDPDPKAVLAGRTVPLISSMGQRQRIAGKMGIDLFCMVRFTKAFSSLPPQEFVRTVLYPMQVKELVCGFDFTYGKMGKGTAQDLKKDRRFHTTVVEQVSEGEKKISSSAVIRFIEEGDFSSAERYLGHPYLLEGEVIHGRQIGKTIGFPTANIRTYISYALPLPAVYSGTLEADGKTYGAMINLGHNSSFNYKPRLSLEVHLLDFDGDLYGKSVRVRFHEWVRPEREFASAAQLKEQLEKDEGAIRASLQKSGWI